MIGEAIDTALTLGWALAAWIALMSAAAALALYALLTIAWWACRTAWRGVTGARSAVQHLKAVREPQSPQRPARARTAPTWAQPDKEAA